MKRGTARRSAVVGDRRALERNLARFLLEERGFAVAAEAATAADVAAAVAQHRPDVVLVHEDVAREASRDRRSIIADIRASSPRTRVIVLTTDRATADAALVAAADAVVEEGPGLTELASALSGQTGRTATTAATAGAAAVAVSAKPESQARAHSWLDRFQGAAAAAIIVLAIVFARGVEPPGPEVPDGPARVHVVTALQLLETLEQRLVAGATDDEAADLAREILLQREAAQSAGADTTTLDAEIRAILQALFDDLSPDVQEALVQVLGEDLIFGTGPTDGGTPSPSTPPVVEPSPSAEPQPGPEPSASPSPQIVPVTTTSPAPDPSGTPPPGPGPNPGPDPSPTTSPDPSPSPDPSQSPSPDPSQSPSPDPSPTQTTPPPTTSPRPSPSESVGPTTPPSPSPSFERPTVTKTPPPCGSIGFQCANGKTGSPLPKGEQPHDNHKDATVSGTIYVVPPVVVLLATSGLARRLARRRDRRR